MQKLQLALPTGWAMDALHKLISFGAPPSEVLWHLGVMVAGTVILLLISARIFRYE
jgi:ABC-type multidrug transport system permease subunit